MTDASAGASSPVVAAIRRRSREEKILLTLSALGILAVTPFAIYRLLQSHWLAAAADFSAVVIVSAIFVWVWRTHETRLPSLILTVCYMSVVVAVNYISGTSLIIWAYPLMAAAYFVVRLNEGLVINLLAMLALAPVLIAEMPALQMAGVLITLALNNSFAYLYARFSLNYQTALSELASQDPLTGVGNRASFGNHMHRAMVECQRVGTAYFVLAFDVDHFKSINDTYGHAAGDDVLKKIANLCAERSREADSVYRLGGEEFAIVAMGIDFDGALHFADKMCRLIASEDLLEQRPVTVSVGVAALTTDDTMESVMSRADAAMYLAKRDGRNRVCSELDLHDVRNEVDPAEPASGT